MKSRDSELIIYCEGEKTEPNYLDKFKQKKIKVSFEVVEGKGGNRIDIVENAISKFDSHVEANNKRYRKKNRTSEPAPIDYEKWLLIDHDGGSDFLQAVKKAIDNGFHVAYSNMCFEYWILLHFDTQYNDGKTIFGTSQYISTQGVLSSSHSQPIIDLINKEIDKYNKKTNLPCSAYDKKVPDDVFDLLLAKDSRTCKRRIVEAYSKAKDIHYNKESKLRGISSILESSHEDSYETLQTVWDESITLVYKLIYRLGIIMECCFTDINDKKVMLQQHGKTWYYYKGNNQVKFKGDTSTYYCPIYYEDYEREVERCRL